MAAINVNTGMKEIEVEATVYRADGTIKSTDKHKTVISDDHYDQLTKEGKT